MKPKLVCDNGHRFAAPKDATQVTDGQTTCPICGMLTKVDLQTVDPDADTLRPPADSPTPTFSESVTLSLHSAEAIDAGSPPVNIPGYLVIEQIGRGGMAVVYRARQLSVNRQVALKMLANPIAAGESLARFQIEAQAVAQLQHSNIAQVYDFGQTDGQAWMTMELLDGSLADEIARSPKTPGEAAKLVSVLARAMQVSHDKGIIHRDLKPANVLLAADGTPKIADFGLARVVSDDSLATQPGQIMGTPSYMAPEQARGDTEHIGPACDVYALGAMLYHLLTGRPPFLSAKPMQTVQQVLTDEPVRPRRLQPRTPRDLETICLKCLEKSPRRRYATAADLADDLDRFGEGRPIAARPIRIWQRAAKWSRRRPATAALILVSTLGLLTLLIGSAWYNRRISQELSRSERLFDKGRHFAKWVLFDHTDAIARLQGATPAEEALVERILKYLDGLSADAGDDDALAADIAAAYERIAAVQGDPNFFNLGKTSEALATYKKALAIRERILRQAPSDLAARLNHALTRGRLADILAVQGKHGEAKEIYHSVLHTIEDLLKEHPDHAKLLLARATVLGRIGDELEEANDLPGALKQQQQALDVISKLFGSDPKDVAERRELAVAHHRVGRILELQGKLDAAHLHFLEVLKLVEPIAERLQTDAQAQHYLSHALISIGDTLLSQGNLQQALDHYRRAIAIRRTHAVADPLSANVQRDLAIALERAGTALEATGEFPAAAEHYRAALNLCLSLQPPPTDPESKRQEWVLRDKLGSASLKAGRLDEALEQFNKELEVARQLVAENAASSKDRQGIAQAYDNLGTERILRSGSAASLEESIQLYQDALARFQQSRDEFAAMQRLAPLTPDQQKLLDTVNAKINVVQEGLDKLRGPSSSDQGEP